MAQPLPLRRRLSLAIGKRTPVRPVRSKLTRAVASLSFDDVAQTATWAGARVLEAAGLRGTYYVCGLHTGGSFEGLEQHRIEDLERLRLAGHEIGCHTFAHQDATLAGRAALLSDHAANAAFAADALGGQSLMTFAYPYGSTSLRAKLFYSKRFLACRGVSAGLNAGLIDLAELRAVPIEGHQFDLGYIRDLVAEASHRAAWLVFFTHDVAASPSKYGCRPADLEAVVGALVDAQIETMPVKDAAERVMGGRPTEASGLPPTPQVLETGRVSVGARSQAPTAAGGPVSVVIATQRRPAGLERAARSVLRQTGVEHAALQLVIADNDQVPSAQAAAERFAAEAPFPVLYVHEPRSGVANVRNAAVSAASGAFIAFLDDDQEAPPGWLAALLDTQARFDADAVFGPVQARLPERIVEHRAYFEQFFAHPGPENEGLEVGHTACGNSLVRRAALPDPLRPFSERRNETGGEDDLLYGGMRDAGARLAWSPAARIFEDPLPERLSLGYAIPRAFAYGHGPTVHCAASNPPDRLGIARWMVIGAAQALAFGLLAVGKWLVGAEDRAFALDRAARGLGKTLWWRPFHIRFYGRDLGGAAAATGSGARPRRVLTDAVLVEAPGSGTR